MRRPSMSTILNAQRTSAWAFIRPEAASSITRLRRTATSENSAATKKPLATTSTRTAGKPPAPDVPSSLYRGLSPASVILCMTRR